MEPISLLLLAAASLGVSALGIDVMAARRPPDSILVRSVWKTMPNDPNPGEAVELLSEAALLEAGAIFDLDLRSWIAMCRSSFYRAVVLIDLTAGEGRHAVLRLRKAGTDWVVDVAYAKGCNPVRAWQRALGNKVAGALGGGETALVRQEGAQAFGAFRPLGGWVPPHTPLQWTVEDRRSLPSMEGVDLFLAPYPGRSGEASTRAVFNPWFSEDGKIRVEPSTYYGPAVHAFLARHPNSKADQGMHWWAVYRNTDWFTLPAR